MKGYIFGNLCFVTLWKKLNVLAKDWNGALTVFLTSDVSSSLFPIEFCIDAQYVHLIYENVVLWKFSGHSNVWGDLYTLKVNLISTMPISLWGKVTHLKVVSWVRCRSPLLLLNDWFSPKTDQEAWLANLTAFKSLCILLSKIFLWEWWDSLVLTCMKWSATIVKIK